LPEDQLHCKKKTTLEYSYKNYYKWTYPPKFPDFRSKLAKSELN